MCAAQVLACSPRERNDSKQNKRVPNFLIDTILNKIPHDTTAPMVSPSASMLLGRQSFDMQRERALLAYAHQLTRWGVWIQTAKATSSQYATSLKSTLHKNKTKETKVWNPIHSYSDHLTSEGGSTTDEDENHIGKLRQMSNVLAKEENEVAATGKIDVQKIATANLTNLQNEKKLNSNEAKEVKNQALWPAWVYCTRYSNRPSAGPRTRKNQRKNRLSKTDGNDDKRARTVFSPEQLDELQREFNESQYLTGERRVRLANNLGLTMAQIKVWFQNKRAKVKKNSGGQNVLAMQLRAQGLYDHSTYSASNNTNTIIATTNNSHNEQEKI